MGPLQGQAMMEWMADLLKLQGDLSAAAQAGKDLEALRAALAPLSDEMASAIGTFGVAPGETVYELHCPMAFGGKGANWLQPDDKARNPYFGKKMPTCSASAVRITPGPQQRGGGTQ
jgi:Cu(I)/Ag(I) efflux system membrane fusion protein